MFYVYLDGSQWVFTTADYSTDFPAGFEGFDVINHRGPIVYITDSIQALVAFDWLLEHGWEWDRVRSCVNFIKLYEGGAE